MAVRVYRQQFIQSPAKGGQIEFFFTGGQNPMHVIVAQTIHIVLHTQIMMEYGIFRIFETTVDHQRPDSSGNPYITLMVAGYEAHLMAFVDRKAFQVVAVIDKYLLTVPVAGQIIYPAAESGNPDTTFIILVDAIHIIIAQTVNIIFPMLITCQFIAHLSLRFRFYQALSFGGNPKVVSAVLKNKIDIPS